MTPITMQCRKIVRMHIVKSPRRQIMERHNSYSCQTADLTTSLEVRFHRGVNPGSSSLLRYNAVGVCSVIKVPANQPIYHGDNSVSRKRGGKPNLLQMHCRIVNNIMKVCIIFHGLHFSIQYHAASLKSDKQCMAAKADQSRLLFRCF